MEGFSALLVLCAGNSPVTDEFPSQRPVMRSFDVFFDMRLNKRLNNNSETGDLRRNRAYYDVVVMFKWCSGFQCTRKWYDRYCILKVEKKRRGHEWSNLEVEHDDYCPASRTTLVATRFRVAVICPIIQVPHCIRVFFYFVWFVFINHIFQFYYELCTYCNILDIYLS